MSKNAPDTRYLVQKPGGHRYLWTAELAKRADMHEEIPDEKKEVVIDPIEAVVLGIVDKDDLEKYARVEHGVELDKRKSLKAMQTSLLGALRKTAADDATE